MPPSDYRFCPRCGSRLESRRLKEREIPRLVCPSCAFVFYIDPKVAAGAIFLIDGGVVLSKRGIEPQMGKWVFPGGFVDRGESVQDAAIRETMEEVNIRLSLVGILDVYSFKGNDVILIVFAGDVAGGTLEAKDESLEVSAFPPESIPWDDLAFESTKIALRDYVRRFFPRVRVPR